VILAYVNETRQRQRKKMTTTQTVRCRTCYTGFQVKEVKRINFCQNSCRERFMNELKKECKSALTK